MSDFDTFVSVANNAEDPAAEFLAREQNALAELEDDFEFPQQNTKDLSQKINGNYANGDSHEFTQLNDINGPNVMSNGDDIDNDNDNDNGFNEDMDLNNVINNNAINSSQTSDKYIHREEPEKIKKWREEQNRLLEQKDEEEKVRREELKQTAKHELEEWYARYSEQLEKSKLNNREASKNAEKEWVAERDTEVPGLEWEKIARMCDFNPKSTRNTKDTSRMRSILLQLKQNPPAGQNSKS